jgi:hypothetical protein
MHRTTPHSEHQRVRRHKLDRHRVVAIERRYGSSNELISDRVVRHHGSGSSAFYFGRSSVFRLAANQTREQVQPVDTPSSLLLFASRAPSPTTTAVEKVDNQIQWCALWGAFRKPRKGLLQTLFLCEPSSRDNDSRLSGARYVAPPTHRGNDHYRATPCTLPPLIVARPTSQPHILTLRMLVY